MPNEPGGDNAEPLPITIIGGYLGTGKTTLVNHLLRHADRRLGVLVNDFGAVNIDSDLIEGNGDDADIVRLTGGCVCCQFGDDLSGAVMRLAARPSSSRPEHLIVETSGVALPGPLRASLQWLPAVTFDAAVVVVDAENVRRLADDRFVGDVVRSQLDQADVLLLSKSDLVDDALEVFRWLAAEANGRRVVPMMHGVVEPAVVIGPGATSRDRLFGSTSAGVDIAGRFASLTVNTVAPVDDPVALAARLASVPGLWRVKGFVTDRDGRAHLVQIVGGRATVTPWTARITDSALVCIGVAAELDANLIESSISEHKSLITNH